ncbi:ATP-binding protein [Methylomonas paludis]|uniref:ATP-binding protein n=1 Tax=Methylomonas paludis TaxID=1173101 RepID=A0A975RA21_9GAMM|nr:ATP-binding protein [Methylomonas paludis]QWF70878.1 ATP-binding protein [Methylomonas paludis]
MIDWNTTYAAIWRQRQQYLRPVKQLDELSLAQLIGIDQQKQQLIDNTERFISGLPANNALLWGARGTGKSSLIKGLLNAYKHLGLRVVQLDKEDLIFLPEIVDELRELPQRFIIYCDDLSFETGEVLYKPLKSILEGSIEPPPQNVLFYATSNRRHLQPEHMRDNLDTKLIDGEVHYADTIEEKISLSDRFGLRLAFYPPHSDTYLNIVDHYFSDYQGDREQLHRAALAFAHQNAAKNGRSAKQFYNSYTETRQSV